MTLDELKGTCFHEHLLDGLQPVIGRTKHQMGMWMRKARIPQFIGLSATSVCLLSSSTKLLLQLMLIMMLIMIPLSVVKCPIAVASAHRQSAISSPSPIIANKDVGTKLDKISVNQALSRAPHYELPIKSYQKPSFIQDHDDGADESTIELRTWHEPSMETSGQKVSKSSEQQQQQASSHSNRDRRRKSDTLSSGGGGGGGGGEIIMRRSKRASPEQLPLGCHQLLSFWNFLRGSYPSLASHMFALASTKSDERLMVQTVKTVGRLLEEAERLVRDQLAATGRGAPEGTQRAAGLRPAASAWLARVTANPLYNKIVQHFQDQHRQLPPDRHQQRQHEPMAKSANTQHLDSTSDSTQRDSSDSSHVYGRVIHYPHEASNEASKTLDKLKLIGQQHQRALSHHANEIDRTLTGSQQAASDEIESNRIPLMTMAGDGEPWPTTGHRQTMAAKFEPDNANSARNKYVYGDVLLKPNQKSDHQQAHTQHHNRHSSLGVLRQLSDDLDRSLRLNEPPDDSLKLASPQNQQQQNHNNEPTSESYGRVLVSPPNPLSDRTVASERLQGLKEQQATGSEHRVADSKWAQNDKPGVFLDKQIPRPFLEAAGGSSSRDADELANQQHGASMAAHAPEESANEFEGVWYSGPLQQVEVRQLRSDSADRTKGSPPELIVHTTSSLKDVILVD